MNILRSIDVDRVFDNVSINIDESISDIFSTSVDKDLIPSRYELQTLQDKQRLIFSYDLNDSELVGDTDWSMEIKSRGFIIKKIDFVNKKSLVDKLNNKQDYEKYNAENLEIIKFIVANFLEA